MSLERRASSAGRDTWNDFLLDWLPVNLVQSVDDDELCLGDIAALFGMAACKSGGGAQ